MCLPHIKRQLAHAQVKSKELRGPRVTKVFHTLPRYTPHPHACRAADCFMKASTGLRPDYRRNECGGKEKKRHLRLPPSPRGLPFCSGTACVCVFYSHLSVCLDVRLKKGFLSEFFSEFSIVLQWQDIIKPQINENPQRHRPIGRRKVCWESFAAQQTSGPWFEYLNRKKPHCRQTCNRCSLYRADSQTL